MEKITSSKDIQAAIFSLQQKKDQQRVAIENEIDGIHQSLGAANILKSALHNIIGADGLKTKAVSSALGLGSGLVAQKIVAGESKNIFRNLLGTIVQIAVTGLVAKNSGKLASKSPEIGKKVFG
jgi:hypothetical protein